MHVITSIAGDSNADDSNSNAEDKAHLQRSTNLQRSNGVGARDTVVSPCTAAAAACIQVKLLSSALALTAEHLVAHEFGVEQHQLCTCRPAKNGS